MGTALFALSSVRQASRQALRSSSGSTPALPFHSGMTSAGRATVSADLTPLQPSLHLIGGKDHIDAGDIAISRGAVAGEFNAAHHAVEPRIVKRRHAATVFGCDHALDQLLHRLALGLADGLIARFERVGGGNVDINSGHRVGIVAAAWAEAPCKANPAASSAASIVENQRPNGIAGVRFLFMFASPI